MPVPPPAVLRAAGPADAGPLARIYNEGIADRVATFETEPRSAADMSRWLDERAGRFPVLVAEVDGEVVAWAGAGEYQPRACYRGVATVSVYVARSARHSGIGSTILLALGDACQAAGFWKMLSLVFPENEASLRMCARAGFREAGVHLRHGRLDGAWRDCVIVERLIGEAAAAGAV